VYIPTSFLGSRLCRPHCHVQSFSPSFSPSAVTSPPPFFQPIGDTLFFFSPGQAVIGLPDFSRSRACGSAPAALLSPPDFPSRWMQRSPTFFDLRTICIRWGDFRPHSPWRVTLPFLIFYSLSFLLVFFLSRGDNPVSHSRFSLSFLEYVFLLLLTSHSASLRPDTPPPFFHPPPCIPIRHPRTIFPLSFLS